MLFRSLASSASFTTQTNGWIDLFNMNLDTAGHTITAGTGRIFIKNTNINGHTITADAGSVTIQNTTIDGGSLRTTDNASSKFRFIGDITMTGVPWEDPGAGSFEVHSATRFWGDYAHGLPEGYTLNVGDEIGRASGRERV